MNQAKEFLAKQFENETNGVRIGLDPRAKAPYGYSLKDTLDLTKSTVNKYFLQTSKSLEESITSRLSELWKSIEESEFYTTVEEQKC